MLINGSLSIDGELLIKNTIPKKPPKGYTMIWFSNGQDTSFINSDRHVSNNNFFGEVINACC